MSWRYSEIIQENEELRAENKKLKDESNYLRERHEKLCLAIYNNKKIMDIVDSGLDETDEEKLEDAIELYIQITTGAGYFFGP